jgi:hypothetical protein
LIKCTAVDLNQAAAPGLTSKSYTEASSVDGSG